MRSEYRCVTPTLEGFVQQLAVAYVARNYHFYVTGGVGEGKDPKLVDETMLRKFNVRISKWARHRRKKRRSRDGRPLANTQYIRHERFFVLLCTHGHHRFFEEHRPVTASNKNRSRAALYADVRKTPIVYSGYSVGYRNGHVTVRMSKNAYKQLKEYFEQRALTLPKETLEREFSRAPFEPYGGVTSQMFCILRAANRIRKKAGMQQISTDCVRTRRRSLRPFEIPEYPSAGSKGT